MLIRVPKATKVKSRNVNRYVRAELEHRALRCALHASSAAAAVALGALTGKQQREAEQLLASAIS